MFLSSIQQPSEIPLCELLRRSEEADEIQKRILRKHLEVRIMKSKDFVNFPLIYLDIETFDDSS